MANESVPTSSRALGQLEQEHRARNAGIACPCNRGGLGALLRPRSIAVIGASERPGSVGAAVVRNLQDAGFAGPILPVNPKWERVFGLRAFARVAETPTVPDLTVICTPAPTVPGLVRQCGEAGVGGLLILSAGFRETGELGIKFEAAILDELARFPPMRAIGPNCLGLIVPALNLNASFARTSAKAGGVALLSQSGALCTAILGWAQDEGIGFSHFVSVGNMADVGFGDLLDYLAEQTQTTAVVLYIEAITHAPHFMAAAKRCTTRKPVIAYKAGRHAAGARAAASHTGAMAGEDAVYQAAFDEAGIIRVDRLDDLLSTAELLGRGRWPRGPRLGIVSNAGGPGVIAADTLISAGGVLATLAESTIKSLDATLPTCWSHGNPVDVIGDAGPERLAAALRHVIQDAGVDGALAILTPQAMIDTTAAARAVAGVASRSDKPVLAAWMGGGLVREGVAVLQAAGIPTYDTPEQAVGAFLHLAVHWENARNAVRTKLPEVGDAAQRVRSCEREAADRLLGHLAGSLNEPDSKALFSAYGIPVTRTLVAGTREEAIAAAHTLAYPVVLKVVSPLMSHKTDVGGVAMHLRTDEAVGAAFDQIRASLARTRPDAVFEGVTVQPMLDRSLGVELIIGVKRDATFGPVVLVGAGGTAAEILGDRAIGLAPLDPDRARRLIGSLRIAPLLNEYRGRPPLNIGAAADVMVRMSRMLADLPMVREAEGNPILVTPAGATALDARVVLSELK